jgi:hypothetical protein
MVDADGVGADGAAGAPTSGPLRDDAERDDTERDDAEHEDIADSGRGNGGADMTVEIDDLNIYDELGITPDAGVSLAREMYWKRVEKLREAELNGDQEARQRILQLNEALAIVIDSERRAAYDAARAPAGPRYVEDPVSQSVEKRRALLTGALLVTTIAVAVLLFVVTSPGFGLAAIALGAAFLGVGAVGVRREDRDRAAAFATLRIPPDSSRDEVDTAYRLRVDELLSQLKQNPELIYELEDLDHAYVRASEVMTHRSPAPDSALPVEPGGSRRGASIARAVGASAGGVVRRFSAAAGRLIRVVGAVIVSAVVAVWLAAGTFVTQVVRPRLGRFGRDVSSSAGRAGRGAGRAGRASYSSARSTGETMLPRLRDHMTTRRNASESGLPAAAEQAASVDLQRRLGGAPTRPSGAQAETQTTNGAPVSQGEARPSAESQPQTGGADPAESTSTIVLDSAVGARRVRVSQAPLRVGSDRDCDLVLPAGVDVAAEHAVIWERQGTLLLHVVAGGGECLVNGRPATWASLDDGDVIRIGETELRIERDG